jgi:broad specificity phosphatase PhoE
VRLLLLRHGESLLSRDGRYAGHVDTPLHPSARRPLLALRRRLARFRPVRVFSSDLLRCRQSAALLAPAAEIALSAGLRELRFGRWEGLTPDECRARDPRRFERWTRDPLRHAPPGGETLRSLRARVRRFVAGLARRYAGRTVALVTHGGPIRALLTTSLDDFWAPKVPPASLHVLDWKEGSRRSG